MAVFKVPRITSVQRSSLLLEASEIVYDTTENQFYGGNGIDIGGKLLGGGGLANSETFLLLQSDIDAKQVVLSDTPLFPSTVGLLPDGGIPQRNGIDFNVTGNTVSWNGLGLDNFLEVGDQITITY